MTLLRAIDVTGRPRPERQRSGKPPKLAWVGLDKLVVDDSYQRPITERGWRNIHRIAENFNWAAFSTVILAPARKAGFYNIIDGQHRCHAAALLGMDSVPCQIVEAAAAEQARAFEQINGNVTTVHNLIRFHARIQAGDPEACTIAEMAREAGVTLNRYPVSAVRQKPAESGVTYQLAGIAQKQGRDMAVLAMRAIVKSGTAANDFNAGMLTYEMIWGVAMAFTSRKHWGEAALLAGFATIPCLRMKAHSTLGSGAHSRASRIAEFAGRELEVWRQQNGIAVAAPAPVVDHSGVVRNARGVSLPRLKSLEGAP